MSNSKKLVPKIRFKGFSGEWEREQLSQLANFSKGCGYSKNDLRGKGIPIILYGRLYTQYQTVISEVDTFVNENSGSVISEGNEVIVPASGETAEDIARASAVIQSGIILGGDLNVIYPNEEVNSIFLALSISNGLIWKELSKKAQGKSVVHLRNGDLQEVELKYPTPAEQTKIGNFFQNIDTLIQANQKKLDKLKNIKKASLEKMFPRKGATTPEIRFKGFSGEWEEKTLGEIALFNPKDDLPDIFEYVDLESVVGTEMISHREERKETAPSRAQRLAKYGDVFYQTVRPYQKNNYLFKNQSNNYVFSTGYAQIRPCADGYCLFSILQSDFFVSRVLLRCTGTSYPAISSNDLAKIEISLPTQPIEQTQIGNYFQNLDNLISKTEQKLEKLKNIKKGSLEKMFVNTSDAL